MRETGRVRREPVEARSELLAPFRTVQLGRERGDRGPVQVEPPVGVPAGREHEQRTSDLAFQLVVVELDLAPGDRRDRDHRDPGIGGREGLLEQVEPGLAHASTLREDPRVEYGTGFRRVVAWLLELLIVSTLLAVGLILGGSSLFIGFVIGLTAIWLYFAGFESSAGQATLSGRLLGFRVTDLRGERISFTRASARHFAMYLSAVTPFAIGYWMAFWTQRRQTLHDLTARTLVLKK